MTDLLDVDAGEVVEIPTDLADATPAELARAAVAGGRSVLARPPAPTRAQARAAGKARAREARTAKRVRLTAARAARGPKVPAAGLPGRAGGAAGVVDTPAEYRGTTVQLCGLWPWAVGSGTPMIGTPIGQHLITKATVCFDPISWFMRAKLISNPSVFVLGLPGLGKSTFVRKLVIGAAATGVVPMILGDLRPDYVALVRALGGQVVSVGRGLGYLNPLAVGALGSILPLLVDRPETYRRVSAEVAARRLSMTCGLVTVVRGSAVTDTEETVLGTALRLLDEAAVATGDTTPPLLVDLLEVVQAGGPRLRRVTLTDTDVEYRAEVKRLSQSLQALIEGPVGEVFSQQTSVPLDLTAPAVCIDVSSISASDDKLRAAVLLACWSDGFGAIEAAHTLADEGLGPQRFFFAVLDELWRVIRVGVGMVDRVDELTRLNRALGLGLAMITHSMDDLAALTAEEDRAKARGFVERAGAVVCGGLPAREIDAVSEIVSFTATEKQMITKWSAPAAMSVTGGKERPPGEGKFLIKIGSRTGIPVHTELVAAEDAAGVHKTNARWEAEADAGAAAFTAGFDTDRPLDPGEVDDLAAVAADAGITAATPGPEVVQHRVGADPGEQAPDLPTWLDPDAEHQETQDTAGSDAQDTTDEDGDK